MDVTWSLGIVSVWSTAEPNLGIVSACLPTMKPLLRRVLPQSKSRTAAAVAAKKGNGSSDSKDSSSSSNSNNKKTHNRYGPSTTASFGSSGGRLANKMKMNSRAHQLFRELDDDDDADDYTTGDGTQTRITGGGGGGGDEAGKRQTAELAGIPLNAIEVQTNLDWQHSSRERIVGQ
ncbi:MAG: hypothetical protein LQ348_005165 [Seirophora lacunosa]|nr:MAG: hypothetical protein LQ348_005165 [Seirophora lacunosa]